MKMTNLKFYSNLAGANELTHWGPIRDGIAPQANTTMNPINLFHTIFDFPICV